jgi:prepilin-type N-terminal cleavage/methylation domain-containing protein
MQTRAREDGFTLVEILIAMAMLSILAGAIAPLVVREMGRTRRNDTSERMLQLLDGMVGRPQEGFFGYVGDMGELPDSLQDLVQRGSQPAFTQTSYGFGVGWNGPYVSETGPLGDPTQDAWGTAFDYDNTQAQVRSAAADHALGTGDDLVYPAVSSQTSGILTVTVLGIPSGTSTTVPLSSSEATGSVTISNAGSLGTVNLAGSGPFYTSSAIHTGFHAVVITGIGSYSGTSATQVVQMLPGNTALTMTLVQP